MLSILIAWNSTDISRWRNATATSTYDSSVADASPMPALSSGAVLGLSIGATAMLLLSWRRRWKSKQLTLDNNEDAFTDAELSVDSQRQPEVAGKGVHKVNGQELPNEADDMSPRSKLDSGWTE